MIVSLSLQSWRSQRSFLLPRCRLAASLHAKISSATDSTPGRSECCRRFWHRIFWWRRHQRIQGTTVCVHFAPVRAASCVTTSLSICICPSPFNALNHSSNAFLWLFLPQLTEKDQELYQNFPLVISERWQAEVSDTVFETINQEADKAEAKKKSKHRKFDLDEKG